MSISDKIQVKIIASPENIARLIADFESTPNDVSIVSSGPEDDPTSLQFGLIEAAAVAAILSASFYTAELAAKLYAYLKKDSDEQATAQATEQAVAKNARTIIVQTPLDRTTFEASKDLKQKDIQAKLQAMIKVRR